MTVFSIIVLIALLARWGMEWWLSSLNRKSVLDHAQTVPEAFRSFINEQTYRKSVDYTLARNRFGRIEDAYSTVVLGLVLFSGLLPELLRLSQAQFGTSVWAQAGFLLGMGMLLAIPGLPFDWYSRFRLEERFGFNTTTFRLWCMDHVKGALLGSAIGYPLVVVVLSLVEGSATWWWLWAWLAIVLFQLVMVVIAPIVILPLFNKFTPLPEGSLRERLLNLAQRADFHARSIQVMDGSKRSRHSNAFFTGFKRFRKIVLFDTLIQQLTESEVEAVLAHEIGHYKRGHIPKILVWSALGTLAAVYVLALLTKQDWFYSAFGFRGKQAVAAFLLFSLLSATFTFWFSPLAHWWSRRFEFEADAYAAAIMQETQSLVGALRKISERNLSNLTPHPMYSRFYYSHPTLLEREAALKKAEHAAVTTSFE